MLKMFHCPYEGCSQVYVAISSFQVSYTSWCTGLDVFAKVVCSPYVKETFVCLTFELVGANEVIYEVSDMVVSCHW